MRNNIWSCPGCLSLVLGHELIVRTLDGSKGRKPGSVCDKPELHSARECHSYPPLNHHQSSINPTGCTGLRIWKGTSYTAVLWEQHGDGDVLNLSTWPKKKNTFHSLPGLRLHPQSCGWHFFKRRVLLLNAVLSPNLTFTVHHSITHFLSTWLGNICHACSR